MTQFQRSDEEFFHQELVRRSIRQIASGDSFTIYCGAGVTIDRTTYGWGGLIADIFAPEPVSHEQYPTTDEIDLLLKREDPLRLASMLMQYAFDQEESEERLKQLLVPHLQARLYKSNSWQSGRLSRSVCGFACRAAMLHGPVHIVTTNYDTWLETSFERERGRLQRQLMERLSKGKDDDIEPSDVLQYLPRLHVWYRERAAADESEVALASEDSDSQRGGEVHLHYVHGRVPPEGPSTGHLVISEHDYAVSRPFTQSILRELFAPGRRVVIVGASLTDPPLIDALALTKRVSGAGQVDETAEESMSERFVLMPRTSIGYLDQPASTNVRVVRHQARRCELLGVRLVVPDFRFQSAQFFEELQSCLTPGGVEAYFATENGARYGLRLTSWWRWWQTTECARDPFALHGRLAASLKDEVSPLLERSTIGIPGDIGVRERLRLELWVRDSPGEERSLVMWGNTGSVQVDPRARRVADLELSSSNASVRTLLEGRPQLLDGAALGVNSGGRARWASYMSVPIYAAHVVGKSVSTPVDGRFPVGVVTLASSATLAESVLPLAKVANMMQLKRTLLAVGRGLLDPSFSAPASPASAPAQ